jgi:uncharacterized protein (DUF427 family)
LSQTSETPTRIGALGHVEQGAKRIRVYLGGELVADTSRPLLVWDKLQYPAYYFPLADVRAELLTAEGVPSRLPGWGDGQVFTVRAGGKEAGSAAVRYEDAPFEEIRDAIRFDWHAMDAWFEEDEQVFTHPRNPYTRVDILASSRHVRVEANGVIIAATAKPTLLFETGLPVRCYLPKTDVRMDLLIPTERVTDCPYKGQAEYWSVQLGDRLIPDVAWSYRTPFLESQRIAGLLSFYPDKVQVYLDGVEQT